jgi:AraC-like DNA-binding protein
VQDGNVLNTVNFYQGVEVFISVLGLLQAAFFCVLLLSEGRRAYRANRWMILFIAAVCANLIEDVIDVFGSSSVNYYSELIFQPFNFVIAPAIYLYFCEAAGAVKIRYGLHLAIVPVVANLTFWLLIGIPAPPANGQLTSELAEATNPLMSGVFNTIYFGINLQAVIYVVLLWRVASRYFRQVQKQLGARRDDMGRWLRNVLGSVLFIFLVFFVPKFVGDFHHQNEVWSFQFLNVSFLLVFFWLSYTLATQQVVFVLPDWDDADGHSLANDLEGDGDVNAVVTGAISSDGANSGLSSLYDKGDDEKINGGNSGAPESSIRHFLDKNESELNRHGDSALRHQAAVEPKAVARPDEAVFKVSQQVADRADGIQPGTEEPARGGADTQPRPLLDEDDAQRALRRLQVIHNQGDLLHDPMISLPKLARAVGISPNQLSYVLNHHVGQNFFDYVNSARIAEARRILLDQPDRPILDVALEVGFNSKSTFNLAFKKITGETPSSLRRKESVTS